VRTLKLLDLLISFVHLYFDMYKEEKKEHFAIHEYIRIYMSLHTSVDVELFRLGMERPTILVKSCSSDFIVGRRTEIFECVR